MYWWTARFRNYFPYAMGNVCGPAAYKRCYPGYSSYKACRGVQFVYT